MTVQRNIEPAPFTLQWVEGAKRGHGTQVWLEFTYSGASKMPAEMDTRPRKHIISGGGKRTPEDQQCPAAGAMLEGLPPQGDSSAEEELPPQGDGSAEEEQANDFTEKPCRQLCRRFHLLDGGNVIQGPRALGRKQGPAQLHWVKRELKSKRTPGRPQLPGSGMEPKCGMKNERAGLGRWLSS